MSKIEEEIYKGNTYDGNLCNAAYNSDLQLKTILYDPHGNPNSERVALQAMLGSDRVRELLSFVQLENEDPHPTLFLEKTAPKQLAAAPEPLQLTEGINVDEVA